MAMRKKNFVLSFFLITILLLSSFSFTACSAKAVLTYQADDGGSITGNLSQSIGIGKNGSIVTAVADDGYFFVRWSDGYKYPERQDKDVQEAKTFTAIFAPITRVYKILMVYVTEIQATLETDDGTEIEVDYRLTETELKICELTSIQMGAYLNDMLDGLVYFDVDTVFTTEVVREESINQGFISNPDGTRSLNYTVRAEMIPEFTQGSTLMEEMFTEYHTVMTVSNMNDYDGLLYSASGTGGRKYATVHMESQLAQFRIAEIPYEALFDLSYSGYMGLASWDGAIRTYIHEFTHTIEANYWYDPVQGYLDYHTVLNAYGRGHDLHTTKQYLLNKAVLNGETGGIPEEFWDRFKIN